jgi:hypothetical protein
MLANALFGASFTLQLTDISNNQTITKGVINDSKKSFKSDENGTFHIETEETLLHAKGYGYRPLSFVHDNNITNIMLEPIEIQALYLSFWAANATSPRTKNILNIIDENAANAIVVDIKNEYGSTSFKTSFAQANSYGAYHQRTNRDIEGFMGLMKEKKVYTIARICTFMDDLQASNNPEYAIKRKDGSIWRNHDGMGWVDPFDKRSHEYAIRMAEEAAKVGFDEINFDYIRFPARDGLVYSKESTLENRTKAIEEFLELAQSRLRKYGVFVSVDTYGNIFWANKGDDNNIGQTVESMEKYVDYIAPMLYPSGFANGSFGYKHPSEHPYVVINRTIVNKHESIDPIRVRPWLQYFKDYAHNKRDYKKFEVQEQIRGALDANTSGWMVWSPSSRYHLEYFQEEKKEEIEVATNP